MLNILTMVEGWLRSVNVSETKELGLPIYVSDRGMGFGVVVVAVDRSPYLEFSSKRSCVRLEPLARSERNLGRTLIRPKLGLLHSFNPCTLPGTAYSSQLAPVVNSNAPQTDEPNPHPSFTINNTPPSHLVRPKTCPSPPASYVPSPSLPCQRLLKPLHSSAARP